MIVNQLLVEPSFTAEKLKAKYVEQRVNQIGRLGEYVDQPKVMTVSHMTHRSFLNHDVDTAAIY